MENLHGQPTTTSSMNAPWPAVAVQNGNSYQRKEENVHDSENSLDNEGIIATP